MKTYVVTAIFQIQGVRRFKAKNEHEAEKLAMQIIDTQGLPGFDIDGEELDDLLIEEETEPKP